jgi:hypothetical protein
MLAAAFLLPLEVEKRKRLGKTPSRFTRMLVQQLYHQRSYFSAALKPLKPED